MGRVGEQSPRALLHADRDRSQAADGRAQGIRPPDLCHPQGAQHRVGHVMRQLLRRTWYLIRRRKFEADLADEIEFHRAMKQRELEERGLEPRAATFATRRALGSVALAEDHVLDVWQPRWL